MKRRLVVILAVAAGTACHRGPQQPGRVSVSVEPTFMQFTRAGDKVPFLAKATDAKRNPVSDAKFAWHSSDTSVATVSKDGLVTALKDGITRVWAISGGDSSFAVAVVQLPHNVSLTLAPALAHFDALSDTTTLTLTNPDSLTTPKPMCMADDDHVAVVDSEYRVHSVGNGTTLVRCRSGEAEGSMRVTVTQRLARVGIVTGVTRTLRMELDTIHLGLAKVDKTNTPMDVGTPVWRSLDTGVVAVDPSNGTAVGKAEGQGRVVAMLNGLADTTLLDIVPKEPAFAAVRPNARIAAGVGQRSPRGAPGGGGARGTASLGPRPVGTVISAREIVESDSVFQARTTLAGQAPGHLRLSLTVVNADYQVAADGTTGLVDERTGLMYGAQFDFEPSDKFNIHFSFADAPTLSGATGSGLDDFEVSKSTLDFGIGLTPWLALQLGGGFRGFFDKQTRDNQQWFLLRTGAEAKFDIGGPQGVVGFTYFPVIVGNPAFTTTPTGFSGSAGVDYQTGRLSFGARYELERYAFPGDNSRKEQFSSLKLKVGLSFGGN